VVFAPDARVDALKDAIISKLKLDVPAHRLRLLCKVNGGNKPLLLESGKTLAAQGVGEGSRVVVEGMTTPLKYFLKLPKGKPPQPLEAEFTTDSFSRMLQLRTLIHRKKTTKGESVYSTAIYDLEQAAAVCALGPSDYLLLEDPSLLMQDEVSSLKGFTKNMADGFEQLSTKALAINMDLQSVYGKLEPLNGGRSVTFFKGGDPYVECDGLLVSGKTVLLNEAKTRFHEADVAKLSGVTALRLREILFDPVKFSTDPEDVLEQLVGCKVVELVASSSNFSADAEKACAKAGVHLLQQDGTGFICTLAKPVALL
jgi:hypothetical protein